MLLFFVLFCRCSKACLFPLKSMKKLGCAPKRQPVLWDSVPHMEKKKLLRTDLPENNKKNRIYFSKTSLSKKKRNNNLRQNFA